MASYSHDHTPFLLWNRSSNSERGQLAKIPANPVAENCPISLNPQTLRDISRTTI
jgi:hypothetical protein